MDVGALTLRMAADVAQLRTDMTSAKGIVDQATKEMVQLADVAKKALAAIGVGMSAAWAAGVINGAIEGAAALGHLSTQTGASVEALSGMKGVAKLVGADIEQVAGAMNKLSKGMAVTNDESKGAGAAVAALGLHLDDFKKLKPDEQMQAVAKSLAGFEDSGQKAAVAMALFGKEGAKLLPFLKELGEAGDLHAKVTTKQSEQAIEYEKNLRRLTASSEAWKKEIGLGMLPALQEASGAMLSVFNGAGGLREQIKKLSADGSIAEWTRQAITGLSYIVDVIQITIRAFKTLGEAIYTSLRSTVEGLTSIGTAVSKAMTFDFSGATQEVKSGLSVQKSLWGDLTSEIGKTWGEETMGAKFRARMEDIRNVGKAAEKTKEKLDFNGNEKAGKADPQIKAYQALIAAMNEKIAVGELETSLGRKLNEVEKERINIQKLVATGTISVAQAKSELTLRTLELLRVADLEGREALEAQAAAKSRGDALEKEIETVEKEITKRKEATEQIGLNKSAVDALKAARVQAQANQLEALAKIADEIDLSKRLGDAMRQLAQGKRDLAKADKEGSDKENADRLRQQVQAIHEETEALTMSTTQRDIANALRAEEKAGLEKGTAAWYAYRDGITGAITARDAVAKSISDFKAVWTSVDNAAQTTFTNIVNGGQSAFTKLRDTLKSTLLDLLYQMTVKKWIFDISASVTGQSAGVAGAVANAAGLTGGGGGGLIGAAASSLGSMFSATGAATAVETATMTALSGVAPAVTGITGVLGTLTSTLTAMGPIGWAGIAAVAAYSIFGGKSHGPKQEGGYSSDGSSIAGRDIGGNMQGSVRGDVDGAQTISQGISQGYDQLATQLGLLNHKLDVGVFFSKDANGTSQSQLQVTSSAGYNRSDRVGGIENVGRSDDDMKKALAEETVRVIYGALQKSDLPDRFKALLNAAGNAGAAEMQKAIDHVTAAKMQDAKLTEQLYQLTATAEQKIARARDQERAAVEPLNAALLEQVYAQQDLAAATAAATKEEQNLAALSATYQQNFYSSEEQRLIAAQGILDKINAVTAQTGQVFHIGDVLDATRETFRKVAESIDQTTAYGKKLYLTMMEIAQSFAGISAPLGTQAAATNAVTQATNSASSAASAYAQTLASQQAVMQNAIKGIETYIATLSGSRLGSASPENALDVSRKTYLFDLSKARAGDPGGAGRLPASAQAYLAAQQGYTANSGTTQAVISQVLSELRSVPGVTEPANLTAQNTATMVTQQQANNALVAQNNLLMTQLITLTSNIGAQTIAQTSATAANTGQLATSAATRSTAPVL